MINEKAPNGCAQNTLSDLSTHTLCLSTHYFHLSTAVIDVARLIQPPVLPLPKEKAVS